MGTLVLKTTYQMRGAGRVGHLSRAGQHSKVSDTFLHYAVTSLCGILQLLGANVYAAAEAEPEHPSSLKSTAVEGLDSRQARK